MSAVEDELADCELEEIVASIEVLVDNIPMVESGSKLELCDALLVLTSQNDTSLVVIAADKLLEDGARLDSQEVMLVSTFEDDTLESEDERTLLETSILMDVVDTEEVLDTSGLVEASDDSEILEASVLFNARSLLVLLEELSMVENADDGVLLAPPGVELESKLDGALVGALPVVGNELPELDANKSSELLIIVMKDDEA